MKCNLILTVTCCLLCTLSSFAASPFTIDFESIEGFSTTYDAGGTQAAGNLNLQPMVSSETWVTNFPSSSGSVVTDVTAYSGSQSVYLGGTEEWAYFDGMYALSSWHWAVGGSFTGEPAKFIHFMYKPTGTWAENNYQGFWLTRNKYFGGVVFWMQNGEIGVYGSPVWFPFGTGGHTMERAGTGALTMDNWHQVIIHPFLGDDTSDPGTEPDVYLRIWVVNVETEEWIATGEVINLYSGSSNSAYDPYLVFDSATECEDIAMGNYTENAYDTDSDPSYDQGYGYFDNLYFQEDSPSLEVPLPYETCQDVKDAGFSITGDLNGDCYITLDDFALMSLDWLSCIMPNDPDCDEPWNNP